MGRPYTGILHNCLISQSQSYSLEVMDRDSSTQRSTLTSNVSDLELFYAIREGQVDALKILYHRYVRLVYSLALRMLGNPEEAEDLTQEIFLRLWNQDVYQPSRGSLSQFLVLTTRSRAIDRLRSSKSRLRNLQRWQRMAVHESVSIHPLEGVSIAERSQQVQDALAQLSSAEREALEIAYYEGLSQSETAKRLNIPLGTVKTRSRQALKKLRKTLQDIL